MSVTDLNAFREENTPHTSGAIICMNCKHEWEGVAPVGTTDMDCPSCGCAKGVHKQFIGPSAGVLYTCNVCDGTLFTFRDDFSALCAGCGTRHWPFSDESLEGA